MQEYTAPERTLDITPGHWRAEPDFPGSGTKELVFHLTENGGLAHTADPKPGRSYDEYDYQPTVGLSNGFWSGGGISFYLPADQRAEEAYSLVYTSAPFQKEVHILGWPRVQLHVSSSARVAAFVAKLADVAPDGQSALIVDGSLNGTRRKSLTEPAPMVPGEVYELDIPMIPTGWVIKPGHRLRLAVSSADFPNLWPTPEKARNRVYRGGPYLSRVVLPVVAKATLPPPHFGPPPQLRQVVKSYGDPPTQEVIHDQIAGSVTVRNRTGSTTILPDNHGTFISKHSFRCSASAKHPAQASIVGTHTFAIKRPDGTITVTAQSSIRATADAFHILIDLNVTRNGKPFFHKKWMASEPRRLL
jgi:hypothetical protein